MNIPLIIAAVAATSAPDLQQVLDRIRIDQDIPGVSVVVAQYDEILFAGASGVADLETGRSMTPET